MDNYQYLHDFIQRVHNKSQQTGEAHVYIIARFLQDATDADIQNIRDGMEDLHNMCNTACNDRELMEL